MKPLALNLGDRDRRLLAVAIPIVLLLVFVLAAKTLMAQRAEARHQLDRALEDIAWLQAQSGFVAPGRQTCGNTSWSLEAVSSLARRHGVNLASPPLFDNGELRLQIGSSQGNDVVALLAALSCQGGRVHHFELRTLSEQGDVQGTLVLLAPVT